LKKKILYIGGFILPDKNAAALRVVANAKILSKLGYKIFFIGVSKLHVSKEILETKKEFEDFCYFEEKYPSSTLDWIIKTSTLKNVKKIIGFLDKNKIDSIFVYNYPSVAFFKLLVYCKIRSIRIISDITEWYLGDQGNFIFKIVKKIDNNLRLKYLNNKVDGLICISDFLFNFYSNRRKVIKIPPLVDLAESKWEISQSLNSEKLQFVYVGSPEMKESFDNLIISFSNLSGKFDFTFKIIGITKTEILEKYINISPYIKILGPKIKFYGRLSNWEAIQKIKQSHFFIFIRRQTLATKAGFPTKFVESLSAGTPVITNKSSNLEEFLINGKNGFFLEDVNDIEKLTYQLSKILELNNYEIRKMKEFCLESRIFDYNNYIKLFSTLLN